MDRTGRLPGACHRTPPAATLVSQPILSPWPCCSAPPTHLDGGRPWPVGAGRPRPVGSRLLGACGTVGSRERGAREAACAMHFAGANSLALGLGRPGAGARAPACGRAQAAAHSPRPSRNITSPPADRRLASCCVIISIVCSSCYGTAAARMVRLAQAGPGGQIMGPGPRPSVPGGPDG